MQTFEKKLVLPEPIIFAYEETLLIKLEYNENGMIIGKLDIQSKFEESHKVIAKNVNPNVIFEENVVCINQPTVSIFNKTVKMSQSDFDKIISIDMDCVFNILVEIARNIKEN